MSGDDNPLAAVAAELDEDTLASLERSRVAAAKSIEHEPDPKWRRAMVTEHNNKLLQTVTTALLVKRYDQTRKSLESLHGRVGELSRQVGPQGPTGAAVDMPPVVRNWGNAKMSTKGTGVPHRWTGTMLSLKRPDGQWGKEVDLRGPPGPRGPAGPQGPAAPERERVKYTDYSGPRYHYVGRASRISRIDYSVSPALVEDAASGDWDNRYTLDYFPR